MKHCAKKIFFPIAIVPLLMMFGCSGLNVLPETNGSRYHYTYSMIRPVINEELRYQDNYLDIQCSIDNASIAFRMTNKSDQSLSIAWEKVSIVINNQTYSIRNAATFYSYGVDIPPPLSIPPGGFIFETLIPRQNVYFKNGSWVEIDLFPTHDSGSQVIKEIILNSVGSEVALILPVTVGRIVLENSFIFKVSGVTVIGSESSPPSNKRPPKPDMPFQEAGAVSGIVPVIISAGVLGAAIYFLSLKKRPAVDF